MKSLNFLSEIVTMTFAKEKCQQVYRHISDGLEIKPRVGRTLKAIKTLWGRRSKSGTLAKTKAAKVKKEAVAFIQEKCQQVYRCISDGLKIKSESGRSSEVVPDPLSQRLGSGLAPKTRETQVKKKAVALIQEKCQQVYRCISDGLEIKSRVKRASKAIKTLWGRRSKSGTLAKTKAAKVKKEAVALAKEKPKQVYRHISSRLSIKFGLLGRLSKRIIRTITNIGRNKTMKKSEPKRIGIMKHIGYLLAVVALAFAVEALERQGASRAALLIAVIGGVVISVSWILNKIDHK